MKYSIYLGDIDPNNNVSAALKVRRMILWKLLLWDSVVLSDSQLLTDPRIIRMMGGYSAVKGESVDDTAIEDWQKDFELLLRSGLVEVAHRVKGEHEDSLLDVWNSMSRKSDANVPFLPKNNRYAKYLDSIGHVKRDYDLGQIADRFKSNLLSGIECNAVELLESDDTDKELLRMMNEDIVLFRNILAFIEQQLAKGKITQQRYDELYTFVYSCYSTNVPAETDCFVSTAFSNIPFHLSLGLDIEDMEAAVANEDKLRRTWALDPRLLDLMSMESFLNIRKAIQPCISSDVLMKYNTGELQRSSLNEYYDVWEEYTIQLEKVVKGELIAKRRELDDQIEKQYVSSQSRVKSSGVNLIVNTTKAVLGLIPAIGSLITVGDIAKDSIDFAHNMIMLHKRQDMDSVVAQKREIARYIDDLSMGTTIITKYQR